MSALCSFRRTLIRSGPANVRDRRLGEAVEVGQAVQAPPRTLRRPQPAKVRSGGAGRRGAATADQAAPAAVSLRGGEAPAAERSAATPTWPPRSGGRTRSVRGCGVQPHAEGRSTVVAKPTPSGAPGWGSRAPRGGPPSTAQRGAGAQRARRRCSRGRRGVQPRQDWVCGPSRQPAGLPSPVPRGLRFDPLQAGSLDPGYARRHRAIDSISPRNKQAKEQP